MGAVAVGKSFPSAKGEFMMLEVNNEIVIISVQRSLDVTGRQ